MVSIVVILLEFFKRLRSVLGNPELRGLFMFVGLLVALGAFFYHKVEGWNLIDSLYFTVITLTTIGYGDFAPQTLLGKLFTILYVFIGLGVLAVFISAVAEQTLTVQRERRARRRNKNEDM